MRKSEETIPVMEAQTSPRGPKPSRRSDRFSSVVPVEARWQVAGKKVAEPGQAVETNANGGILKLARYPEENETLDITNRLSGETVTARALGLRKADDGTVRGVAVEFLWPNDAFWGLSYRLQRTSAELMRLDQIMREGNIDLRVLRDFRDAVDYVRKTSWAVYEWHDRQIRHRDTATVLPLLTRERIRRATQLCNDVGTEMEAGSLAEHHKEISELQRSLTRLLKLMNAANAPQKAKE